MAKVLILGSQGNLGPALAQAYADSEVIAWDRNDLDITNEGLVKQKLAMVSPDLVYNCAAYNSVDDAEDQPQLADNINGYAVGFIAQACQQIKATLVQYSTEQVFSGDNTEGYNETDLPQPVNRYGYSKLLGETQLQKFHDRFFLIRTEWLYAPANRQTGKKSFNDIMLDLAAKNQPLKGVVDELGKPTYVNDLALASRQLVESGKNFGIYHLANEGVASRLEWAQEIFKIKGIDVTIEPVPGSSFPRKAKRPQYGVLNNNKFTKLRPWRKALSEYLSTK